MQDEAGSCERNVETGDSDSERGDSSHVRIDAAYKKRVMDDLDALLADLQSTTAHISSYQNSQRQQQQQQPPQQHPPPSNHVNNQRGYPNTQDQPHLQQQQHQHHQHHHQPPQDLYSQHHRPPLHHQHHHQQDQFSAGPLPYARQATPTSPSGAHVYYTVEAVNTSYYSGEDEEEHSRSSTPPPLPPPPPSDVLDSLADAHRQEIVNLRRSNPATFQPHPVPSTGSGGRASADLGLDNGVQIRSEVKGRGERMSALSNNLSELDQLLQDLNSAQFMAEVDRKSTINDIPVVINGIGSNSSNNNNNNSNDFGSSSKGLPPQVAPKPKRSTVDCLLDELEGTPKFPVDPQYQELGTANHVQHPSSSSSSSSSSFPPQTASSATKELDDLMMSLSEFKINEKDPAHQDGEPTYAKPIKSRTNSTASPTSPQGHPASHTQLDSMLGDLQSDMNRQGVNTKQKGVCAACSKPIVGQVIAALGQTWHIEHFTCAHCEEPLGTRNFYERDGMAYCETDYHHLFAPRCAYCNGPIVDKCITALEKMWHPDHFFCAQCGRPFGEEDFHEKNGKAYCREDYFAMFAPKCGGCAQPIMENYISALNRQWHPECFVCWDCRAPFGTGSFFDYEGLPYCETHYHAKKGSLCASCEKPITGRCITAMFKKFHPEHFVCAFCLKQLNKGTFKEQNDKPYCHPCFVKLFG